MGGKKVVVKNNKKMLKAHGLEHSLYYSGPGTSLLNLITKKKNKLNY